MATLLRGGASLRTPMPRDDYLSLGETRHAEYYDGMCIVNPPARRHVVAAVRLTRMLEAVCPAGYMVYPEWGWELGDTTFEPDIMIAPLDAPEDLQREPPLLVVEVLSRSTRDLDLGPKASLYADGGLEWYWVVDLEAPEGLSLAVLGREGSRFAERQRLSAGKAGTTVGPVAMELDPAALLD